MATAAQRYRPVITGVVSIILVGVVFTVAGGLIPQWWVPRPPEGFLVAIPHINVAISLGAMATILYGWRAIRRPRRIETHKRAMITATVLFGCFLALYLYRLAVLGGPTPFEGPTWVYQFVYLPVLAAHIILAVICIPLVIHVLALGLTVPVEQLRHTNHAAIGCPASMLWLSAFGLGIVVYLLLYWV